MRSTRSTKYRVQLIILIILIFLFGLSWYAQREENKNQVQYIEENLVPSKKIISLETSPLNETISPDSTNCAYRV